MHVYTLRYETQIPRPLDHAFKFFEDPYNLALITPPWLSFVVTSENRVNMREGAEIDYTIRWLGLPMKWRTLIRKYDPPHMFIDEQMRGPYKLWRHTHTFQAQGETTLMQDEVQYALPLGILGQIAHAVMVGRQLRQIFDYRQQQIKRLLQSP